MPTLSLCADDYGLSAAVCRGILDLVRQERLQAVSVLTGAPAWRSTAAELAAEPAVAQGRVAVGLHVNLTEGRPLSDELARHWPEFPGIGACLLLSHLHRLPVAALHAEWAAQWAAFTEAFGRAPDFVDGHQHVHHLPQVRDVVLAGLAHATPAGTPAPAVRSTAPVRGPGAGLKRLVITHSGGRALARALRARGLRHNAVLLGAYDFQEPDYRRLMQGWLRHLPARGALLFCHPGGALHANEDGNSGGHDPIAAARARERAYLGSDAFMQDLQAAGVTLGPAW